MKPVIDGKNDDVGVQRRNVDTVKYVERKLVDKGVARLDRHPTDGLPLKHDPKKGHGGKYTWEGPAREFETADPALDEKDPNYPEVAHVAAEEAELVVGEVEVAKTASEGVARIELDPHLNLN